MDLMDYRRKIIANSPHLKSASGAIVSFSDGADLPLKSLIVDIEPVQSGSGDPSPSNIRPLSGWNGVKVARCGKNLLNPNYELLNAYIGGNGALTANPINRTMILPCKPDTTYTWTWTRSAKTSSNDDSAVVSFPAKPNTGDIGTYLLRYDTTSGEGRSFMTGSDARWLAIKIGNTTNTDAVATINASMLEYGTTATPYESYNGLEVAIDLGQTVYGGTLNPLTGVLTVYPYYASYNGETLTGRWISDRDVYTVGTTPTNGAQVVDMSGTGTEIQLTPHQIRTLYGNNTIFADTGNVALEYWAHP